MAILKRLFHRHERGMGNEDWWYLARDTETGAVFVYNEWSYREKNGYEPGSAHIDLDAFLLKRGTAQDRLRELIGTLVEDSDSADQA